MVTSPAVLVLDGESPITVGGLTLAERAVLHAHRAGLGTASIWGPRPFDSAVQARLRSRGISVVQRPPDLPPFEGAGDDEALVVVGPDTLFEQAVISDLARVGREGGGAATAACVSGVPVLLYLPRGAGTDIRACRSLETVVARLTTRGMVREWPMTGAFCRRVTAALAPSMERDYIRHLNGRHESFFTRQIRRFSVPLTTRLARLGARPTHVTLGGLALAVASAWCLARGSYLAGLFGGVLYYASMVFDCSDGEVARLTVRDSAFGAWLETIVDYLTYFLVLGAITAASQTRPGAEAYVVAAMVALAGSILVAVVAGYLRHRVAAADPGQFDDASARVLASARPIHRFARWGRQWIKRSTMAHLVLALALVDRLPLLLYLWAFGATLAAVVILAVEPLVIRRVSVAPATVPQVESGGQGGVRS